ncbi:MAG TPA: stealth family protein [Actinoplanes sp.]|nr:stealth family protein [Actinoplanes sp.]
MPVRQILRLAPWGLRVRIFNSIRFRMLPRLAPQHRLPLAHRLVPLSHPPQLPTMRVAWDSPTIRVRDSLGWCTARRDDTASPIGVRKQNLDRVMAALAAADVEHFRIPTKAVRRTAVAVPLRDRERVLALLDELTEHDAGLMEIVLPVPGRLPRSNRRRRRDARVVRVWWPVTDRHASLALTHEYACEIEFWAEHDGRLVAPRVNPVADVVAVHEPATVAAEPVFSAFSDTADETTYPTREVFTLTSPERVDFPIDVVYTWVDGNDPQWQARKARALGDNSWLADVNVQAANDSRFQSRDELRYSLRSLHYFAPWVRRVFIVTDDQVPAWLDTAHPGVTVVSHREVFGDTGVLPTFNSQAIESRLHRIPGLSEHFLYLNDDVFFGHPVTPELFFTPGGLTRFFLSNAVVDSAPVDASDAPVNSAGKNNRALIKQAFGRVLTRKMMHTPHPSRRSVIAEIEQRFASHVQATAAHQFRHPDDIALLSSLQQYYAYLTGRATAGEIKYMYTDLADPATPFRLAELLRRRHLDVFCLNDTDSDSRTAAVQAQVLGEFLPAYFPFRSPFELVSHGGRTRRIEPPAAVPAQADRHTAAPADAATAAEDAAAMPPTAPDVPAQTSKTTAKPVKRPTGPSTGPSGTGPSAKRVRTAATKPAATPTDA